LIKFAIEDKSSGIGLIQLLEDETNIPVTKLFPEKDKVARANDILPRMESAQVLFPKDSSWLPTLEKELLSFSAKKNNNKKDQVDTLTYAVKDLLFDPADEKQKPMNYTALLKETSILNRL
jgi:predicted phage terminase large subunit-like protein